MPHEKLISNLLGIPGWCVQEVRVEQESLVVDIDREAGAGYRCGGCRDTFFFCYDHEPTCLVGDFQVWSRACWLEFSPARVACPRCGIRTEGLDWIRLHQRQALRYELYLAHLCDILPVLDVAELEGMDKSTVYRIDRHWLQRRAETTPMPEVRRLGIDEIAIRKGHRYPTVFYDLERRLVIGLVEGRAAKAVSRFFRRWGKKTCKAIEAVCMDLWTPFMRVVRRYCPRATIVFDKFHVFTYLSTAIDTVRKAEQNLAKADGKRTLKGSRWLWLRKPGTLTPEAHIRLDALMALNKNLQKAYLLREDFEVLYRAPDRPDAEAFLEDWTLRCAESGLAPFITLARRLRRWKEGILAFFIHPITNGFAEGINNTIKVIKRRAYGYHDTPYFFL